MFAFVDDDYTPHRYNTTGFRNYKDYNWFTAEYDPSESRLESLPQTIPRAHSVPRRLMHSVEDNRVEHFRRE
jgi:hypothetical protein